MGRYLSLSTEQPYLVLVLEYAVSSENSREVVETLDSIYSIVPAIQHCFHGQALLRSISGLVIFSISQWETIDVFLETLQMPEIVPLAGKLRDNVTSNGKAFSVDSVTVSPGLARSDILSATSFVLDGDKPCLVATSIYECVITDMPDILAVLNDLHSNVARKMKGFRSGVIMSSLEFDQVMTIMQWETVDDLEAYMASQAWIQKLGSLKGKIKPRHEAVDIVRLTMPKFMA